MVSKRYIRDEDIIGVEIQKNRNDIKDTQAPTGTEKAQTTALAQEASTTAHFAQDLAEQLEAELGPLPGQVADALAESAAALAAAGLAQSEAATAVADAQTAITQAATAISEAAAASTAAAAAQESADGKSTVVRSPSAATAAGSYEEGDQWWQFSGANITGLWLHDGAAWVAQALTNAIIATLDAGKITTGTLAADRISALSITAAKIAADAITTEKIAALAVTASELAANSVVATKIAANAVTAAKINAGAVTTEKLDALAVTAEKIAVGAIIADKIAAGAITTAKLAATAIDGMTITGAVIRTAASGQRMQFDINGLQAYDSSGNVVSTLSSQSGLFRVQSAAVPGRSESTLYLATNQTSGGLAQVRGDTSRPTSQSFPPYFDLSAAQDSAGFSRLSLGSGSQSRGTDHDSFLRIIARAGIPGIRSVDIETGNTDTPLNVGLPGGDLRFWGSVSFEREGDTGFNSASGTTLGAASFIHREHSGLIYFNLVATRSAWGSTQLLATIPLNYRPSGTMSYPATINGAGTPYIGFVQVTTNGQVTLHTTPTNGTTWGCNVAGFFKVA